MKTWRPSKLPLAEKCLASIGVPDVPIETANAAARLGTSAHECAAAYVVYGEFPARKAASRHSVALQDLEYLNRQFRYLWDEVAKHFPNVSTEKLMTLRGNGWELRGTADLVAYDAGMRQVRVGDTKTGRLSKDAMPQLKAYARLAFEAYPDAESCWLCVLRVRDGEYEGVTFTREEILDWWEEFSSRLLGPATYSPGEHCGLCPLSHECPAKTALIRVAIGELAGEPGWAEEWAGSLPFSQVEREQVEVFAYVTAGWIINELEKLRTLIKADAIAAGGTLRGRDGVTLEISEQRRKEFKLPIALPIIQHHLPDTWLDGLEVHKGNLEKAVRQAAPPRRGAANIRNLYEHLKEAGALEEATVKILNVRYLPREIAEPQPALTEAIE